MNEPLVKLCKQCNEPKLLVYFHKNKLKADGHSATCMFCENANLRGKYKNDNPVPADMPFNRTPK